MEHQRDDGTSLHLGVRVVKHCPLLALTNYTWMSMNWGASRKTTNSPLFTYIVHPVAGQPVEALEHKQYSDDSDKADVEVLMKGGQQDERF